MDFEEIYNLCKSYTITSYERMKCLYDAVALVNEKNIEGDFVECGVFKGGSVMNMAYTQLNYKELRHIHLYDTFEGMTKPTNIDIAYDGLMADDMLKRGSNLCICSIDTVTENINQTKYPSNYVHYHKGDVLVTLSKEVPDKISILRLDTDWYESSRRELEVLYPLLTNGGILIIDDYGHWKGAKEATDEYFKNIQVEPKFQEIDYTGVLHVK